MKRRNGILLSAAAIALLYLGITSCPEPVIHSPDHIDIEAQKNPKKPKGKKVDRKDTSSHFDKKTTTIDSTICQQYSPITIVKYRCNVSIPLKGTNNDVRQYTLLVNDKDNCNQMIEYLVEMIIEDEEIMRDIYKQDIREGRPNHFPPLLLNADAMMDNATIDEYIENPSWDYVSGSSSIESNYAIDFVEALNEAFEMYNQTCVDNRANRRASNTDFDVIGDSYVDKLRTILTEWKEDENTFGAERKYTDKLSRILNRDRNSEETLNKVRRVLTSGNF
jgi:hypothetical protein